jgi:hypothetical protein
MQPYQACARGSVSGRAIRTTWRIRPEIERCAHAVDPKLVEAAPRIISDELFQAAGQVATDNAKWSPRRAEPGQWLLKGLVKCGVCGVGTNCHKMRGRNGTWHYYYYYYYYRNHDPIRAGDEQNRCPERNIRADALDTFVFDHIRTAMTHPDQLLAGEQALTLTTPTPDDELLAAELARLDRKIDAADAERRRLIDLYQGGFIELPEMQRRATEIAARRKELQHKRTSLADERATLTRHNQLRSRVHDFATRVHAVIDTLDDTQKQQLLRLLIEDVRVTGWHVQIRLRIALDPPPSEPPHPTGPTTPTGKPSPHLRPVSTQGSLRSVGDTQRLELPTQRHRNRHTALRTRRQHGTITTPPWPTFDRHHWSTFGPSSTLRCHPGAQTTNSLARLAPEAQKRAKIRPTTCRMADAGTLRKRS